MNKKLTKLLIMLLQWLQDWAYDWYDWAWDKKNELYDSLDEPAPPKEYVIIQEMVHGEIYRYEKDLPLRDGYQQIFDHVPEGYEDVSIKQSSLAEMNGILSDYYLKGLKGQLNRQMFGESLFDSSLPDDAASNLQDSAWIPRNITVTSTFEVPKIETRWGRSPIEHLIRAQINKKGGDNDGNENS